MVFHSKHSASQDLPWFIESLYKSCWKGPRWSSTPIYRKQSQLWIQTRLISALENLEDRDSTTLLGNLFQCLNILTMNGYFSLCLSLLSWFTYIVSHLLARHLSEKPSSIFLIASLSVFIGRLPLGSPLSLKHLLQAEQAPFLPLLLKGHIHFSIQLFWWPSAESIPVNQCLSWTGLGGVGEVVSKPHQNSRCTLMSADKKGN